MYLYILSKLTLIIQNKRGIFLSLKLTFYKESLVISDWFFTECKSLEVSQLDSNITRNSSVLDENFYTQYYIYKGDVLKKTSRFIICLIAFLSFLKAKAKGFEWGDITESVETVKSIYGLNINNKTFVPLVSNLKYYFGLNNASFKTSKEMLFIIDYFADYSIDEIKEVLKEVIDFSDEEFIKYVESKKENNEK